jgi:hypothetical protein
MSTVCVGLKHVTVQQKPASQRQSQTPAWARFDGRNSSAFNRTEIASAVSRTPHSTRSRAASHGYSWVIPWQLLFGHREP